MRAGLALPCFDFSVPGESPLRFDTVVEHARRAEALGYANLYLADHLFWDVGKYGGPDDPSGAVDPLVGLGALALATSSARLGTLVLCEALRPASVLAKSLATIDRLSGGRLEIGIGAGYYEPEYAAIGMDLPRPGVRLARLAEAVQVLAGLLGPEGGPFDFDGVYHRAAGARVLPTAVQRPRPPIYVGGKGDRLLELVARHADGWNTCWIWTPDAYGDRLQVLARACERAERDPATVSRTLGLYALCGEDERDLAARWERLRSVAPPGVLDGVTLDEWREGRLVGTVEQVAEQAAAWAELGVETLIVCPGAVPFQVGALDDLEPLAAALGAGGPEGS